MARQVLIFDDSPDEAIREVFVAMCKHGGFEPREASAADDYLAAVRSSPPDPVLMLTNNIVKTSAYTIVEAIRAIHPRCGFVFLSGSSYRSGEEFLAAGYKFHLLPYPISFAELNAGIKQAMDSPLETFVIPESRPTAGSALTLPVTQRES